MKLTKTHSREGKKNIDRVPSALFGVLNRQTASSCSRQQQLKHFSRLHSSHERIHNCSSDRAPRTDRLQNDYISSHHLRLNLIAFAQIHKSKLAFGAVFAFYFRRIAV
jgi:hypothetical protein